MSKLDEALKRVESWSASLSAEVKTTGPQIRKALDPNSNLIEGCPSHQSMAAMCYRQLEKKFSEVEAAMKEVKDEIWATP